MKDDSGIDRGGHRNMLDNIGDILNRFLAHIQSWPEKAAGIINRRLPGELFKVDVEIQPRRRVAIYNEDYWFVADYYIGTREGYQRLREALRQSGLPNRPRYFTTTPEISERVYLFGKLYARMVNYKTGNSQGIR